jgi:hypothetical protein
LEHIERAEVIVTIPRNEFYPQSGSWSHKAAEEFTIQEPHFARRIACRSPKERSMKKLITVTALALLCGPAFAQNTGPAPQTGMEKPGTTNGAKPDGSMDTTGMSATKGNIKRDKDGAPAPKDEKK